ncbi:MAG: hypothetical protein ABI721_04515 [Candidatus Dojkabacteria bacterium]
MRHFFVFFIVGVFFAFIARYMIVSPDISPLNLDMVQKLIEEKNIGVDDSKQLNAEIQSLIDRGLILSYLSPNAYLLAVSILASIFCFFSSIHLFVDKLFFKNFYEKASLFNATRRGLLLCISIGAVVYLRLYRVEDYVLILVPIAAVAIEAIFFFNSKSRIKKMEEVPEDLAMP